MAFGRFEATRIIDGRTESDIRIFVLSRKLSSQALLETVRDHWQIETRHHWQLDVSFGEDAARSRKDNGPANTVVIAVARLDQIKGSLTAKIERAGWNDAAACTS